MRKNVKKKRRRLMLIWSKEKKELINFKAKQEKLELRKL